MQNPPPTLRARLSRPRPSQFLLTCHASARTLPIHASSPRALARAICRAAFALTPQTAARLAWVGFGVGSGDVGGLVGIRRVGG